MTNKWNLVALILISVAVALSPLGPWLLFAAGALILFGAVFSGLS